MHPAKTGFFLAAIVLRTMAQLEYQEADLMLGQGINIPAKRVITLSSSCSASKANCMPGNYCSSSKIDSVDMGFFSTGTIVDDFNCGCGGEVYGAFSKDQNS